MSKRFSNKKCVYCNHRKSVKSGDHIFPRKLFLENNRANLPKVPCCEKCNSQKSKLETELLAILPFGARHSDALENLTTNVPRRLEKNIRLHKRMSSSINSAFVPNESGILIPTMTIPFDINLLFDLFNYITRALVYFHFHTTITSNHFTKSFNPDQQLINLLNDSVQNQITEDLGNGTILYRGIQSITNEFTTLWEYRIYGGLQFLDQWSGYLHSYTCTNKIQRNNELRTKFGN